MDVENTSCCNLLSTSNHLYLFIINIYWITFKTLGRTGSTRGQHILSILLKEKTIQVIVTLFRTKIILPVSIIKENRVVASFLHGFVKNISKSIQFPYWGRIAELIGIKNTDDSKHDFSSTGFLSLPYDSSVCWRKVIKKCDHKMGTQLAEKLQCPRGVINGSVSSWEEVKSNASVHRDLSEVQCCSASSLITQIKVWRILIIFAEDTEIGIITKIVR